MRKLFVVELLSMRRVQATWNTREAEVDKLIGRLSCSAAAAAAGREPVYLEDHIFKLMDGVIGTLALGCIYGSEQFAHMEHFHHLFDEAMAVRSSFSAEDYFPNVAGWLVDRLTGLIPRRERLFRELDAFYDKCIFLMVLAASSMPASRGTQLLDRPVNLVREVM
ncbi:hypothetical protein HU200_009531 [Digitaria exilis]|uniref:Uncharacterized protein n=1 Tax=Digitaria exilis TaxID=1010633 RepID=A0A835FKT6_9POAL|nr:hypothetical protein HU200_009531 [Digitaria exilis]